MKCLHSSAYSFKFAQTILIKRPYYETPDLCFFSFRPASFIGQGIVRFIDDYNHERHHLRIDRQKPDKFLKRPVA